MLLGVPNIGEKQRIVRGLRGTAGRGFAEECGFDVTNNPAKLFQLLYLSILLSSSGDYRRAAQTARAPRDRGWDTASVMAHRAARGPDGRAVRGGSAGRR